MDALASIAAIESVLDRLGPRAPRPVAAALAQVRAAPTDRQEALLAALGVVYRALAALCPPPSAVRCEAYPRLPVELQARLALGERPNQILRGLTRREAHEALAAGSNDAAWWICHRSGYGWVDVNPGRENRLNLLTDLPLRHVAVARWVVACFFDPPRRQALLEERAEQGPGGAEIQGRWLDRIDEIRPKDLPQGPKTSVRDAFSNAAARLYAEWERKHKADDDQLAPPPRWWRPIRCAKLLLSRAALIREGKALSHCVGTYAPAVANKQCVIVSLAVRVGDMIHRSTAELDRTTAEVRQHKAEGNRAPSALSNRALQSCLMRWQRRTT